MAKLWNALFGLRQPDAASRRDAPAAPTPPALIPGARAARELVMLPQDWPQGRHEQPQGERLVQMKADGIRAVYIDGRIVSREGGPPDCALHCQPGLARIEQTVGEPVVIDGEYVAEDGFAATLSEQKRGEGSGVFWCFDMLPLADWQAGGCAAPIEQRIADLRAAVMADDSRFVGMLDAWRMTPGQAAQKARDIWAAGGEGIVSKQLGSPYVRARSPHWLRCKQTHTVDGVVVDVMRRPDGTLKSMVVKPIDHAGAASIQPVVVGSGWSADEGRTLVGLFSSPRASLDIWVEISFQLSTGAKRSVRGATFHRIRSSKGAHA